MISKFGKYIPYIFLIAILFVFLDSIISLRELQDIQNDQKIISLSYRFIHQTNLTVRNVSELQSDYNKYILSNNQYYLTSSLNDWKSFIKNFSILKSLANTKSYQDMHINQLGKQAYAEKKTLDQELATYQTNNFTSNQFSVVSYNDKSIIEKIINEETNIATLENSLLQIKKASFNENIFNMYATIAVSGLLDALLLSLAYVAITRELKQRTILEQKKNDFINLASHELKTPITTLNIFTEILAKRLTKRKDIQTQHLVTKIQIQMNGMKNLINDLLDVTRIQLGKLDLHKETIVLNDLIKNTIEDMQTITQKHTISYKGKSRVEILADPQRIWQVIANLLNNAIKYSPKGGKIKIFLEKKSTIAIIKIKDHGIGISKENQTQIFDRYFREDNKYEHQFSGLGLGLYLTQQIIHLHKGKIWVKSSEGKGSVFYFTLPLAKKKKRK